MRKLSPTPWMAQEKRFINEYDQGYIRQAIERKYINEKTARAMMDGLALILHRAESSHDLLDAVKQMQKACDEWAAEFTQKKRAMDWAIVNNAYLAASRAIAKAEGRSL